MKVASESIVNHNECDEFHVFDLFFDMVSNMQSRYHLLCTRVIPPDIFVSIAWKIVFVISISLPLLVLAMAMAWLTNIVNSWILLLRESCTTLAKCASFGVSCLHTAAERISVLLSQYQWWFQWIVSATICGWLVPKQLKPWVSQKCILRSVGLVRQKFNRSWRRTSNQILSYYQSGSPIQHVTWLATP